jgi:threonine dehydrogenase-like Zn-dependent dehydrogenase
MKALCWMGKTDVQVQSVPDPEIQDPKDVIVRITSTAICGSDLHIYDGYIPTMKSGDVLGHEFMGEVVARGTDVKNLHVGDRVVVPFTISCGACFFCERGMFSLCDNTNPNKEMAEKLYGQSPAGLFGYSHMMGGYPGGQAEYARVPYADVGPIKVPNGLSDEQVLFLSDIFPTGWMAAENCQIQPGDTVAVWGCGPVGQMAIRSAFLLGAGRVFAIDRVPERMAMARAGGAETIDDQQDVVEVLKQQTGDRGPDACIDAVGMEAHGAGITGMYDKVKQTLRLTTDRATALRESIQACRKGGTVSVPGVYGGWVDKVPVGAVFNKGLTLRSGQTHVQKYLPMLLGKIEAGEIDPSFVITHRVPLDAAPEMYKTFRDKEDGCIKVVLKPGETSLAEAAPSA